MCVKTHPTKCRNPLAHPSRRVADRWYAGLQKAIARLGKSPELHPIAEEESERLGITFREMIYGKKPGIYRLLFSIEGDVVVVHSIRHGARGRLDEEEG